MRPPSQRPGRFLDARENFGDPPPRFNGLVCYAAFCDIRQTQAAVPADSRNSRMKWIPSQRGFAREVPGLRLHDFGLLT